jgi:diguanylate cyclase (GGDEF)-like protein
MLTTDLDRLIRLPSLPTVAIELLKTLTNPDAAAADVAKLISADPALAAKVLSVANSARYRGARPIGDIHRASMMLGKRVLCSLALGFSLADASMSRGRHAELFKSYWLRSFAQALAARTLAERYGGCPADEAFTLGLIFRIGELVLIKHMPDQLTACIAAAEESGEPLDIVQARQMGVTSTDLTLRLMARWNLPEQFLQAVRKAAQSESVQNANSAPDLSKYLRVAATVADFIACSERGVYLVRLNEAVTEIAGPGDEDVEWIVITVSKLLRQNAALFHVDLSTIGTPAELLSEATEQLSLLAAAESPPPAGPQLTQELMEENGQLRQRLDALSRETTIDPLTTVFNRRYFQQRLTDQVRRAAQAGTPIALLIGDVDHFKQVNDRYGHPTGDSVLIAVAQTMEGTVRGGDLVARFGGEEFVVLLEANTIEGLRTAAERIRRTVSEIALPTAPGPLSVTISLGGSIAVPTGELEDFETRLLGEADRCLYEAKSGGRNRVVLSPLREATPVAPPPVSRRFGFARRLGGLA